MDVNRSREKIKRDLKSTLLDMERGFGVEPRLEKGSERYVEEKSEKEDFFTCEGRADLHRLE